MSAIRERCFWLREAMARPEFVGEPAPALRGDTDADVLIIGGGYTGLWTAWHLKRADAGINVVVLEQDECGFGPSGRNGGFVNGYYDHAETLLDLFGADGARAIIAAGAQAVGDLASWMDGHGVDAWFRHSGYIGVASSAAQEGAWRGAIDAARTIGVSDRYRELDAAGVAGFARSPVFGAGYFVADGGNLQPARLARGLRRVCMEAGVRIHERTPVTAFRVCRPARASTPAGSVRASQAVLTVGAWAGGWRRFRSRIVTRASFMAITAPAPDRLARIGWTSGVGICDMRATLRYLRTTPDGRIALGVGGEPGAWSGRIDNRFDSDETGTRHAIDAIHRFFPDFRDVPIDGRWGGPIDVAGTHTPYAGTLPSGNVHYAFGYTGNGVAPSYLFGRILAARARGIENEVTRLPFVDMQPKRFPPEPLRSIGIALANGATVRRDDDLDAGRRPNRLIDFVARLPRRLGYHLGP